MHISCWAGAWCTDTVYVSLRAGMVEQATDTWYRRRGCSCDLQAWHQSSTPRANASTSPLCTCIQDRHRAERIQPMQQVMPGAPESDSMPRQDLCLSALHPSRTVVQGPTHVRMQEQCNLPRKTAQMNNSRSCSSPVKEPPHLCIDMVGFQQLSIHIPAALLADWLHMHSRCFHNVDVAEFARHHTCITGALST